MSHGPIGPWVSNDLPSVIVGELQLPVADRHVVDDEVPGDDLERGLDGHVTAPPTDHDAELALVVEHLRDPWPVHVVAGADDAGRLLVEEHR